MPQFQVAVPHQFDRSDMVSRLQKFADDLRENVPAEVSQVEENWDEQGNLNFAFKAMGFRVSGEVLTSEQDVTVQGKLPFAALPFRGAIESAIREQLESAIAANPEGA